MLSKRAALAALGASIAGFGVSLVIAYVHRNLAASADYTSFCNVNEVFSCDLVLSSEYAYFLGIPVAWWALLAYAACAAFAGVLLASPRATRRRQAAGLLFAIALWSLAYSVYLAVVATVVLNAVCLLCGALYLVNAALFVAAWMIFSATRVEGRTGGRAKETWQRRNRFVAAGVSLAVIALLAFALWSALGRQPESLTAEEVAQKYPEFHAWYIAQPVAASVENSGRHSKGGPGSVLIVEFSDFQCPHCARAHRDLKRVLPRFGSDVQVVFRHFPLDNACNSKVTVSAHPTACLAAYAAECAGAQRRFWEYHDLLFDNQSTLDRDSLIGYAGRLGLDREQFVACLDSDAPRTAVHSDVAAAEKLGITSTPTFFLNGRTLRGALDASKLEYAIRLERARRNQN